MKSALPKVLHPLLGRTPARARAGRRRGRCGAEPHRRGGRARRRPGARAPGRGRPGRRTGAAGRAARHRARRADRAGRGAGRRPAPSWCSTATCRCCGRRRWPRWSTAHEAAGARGHRAGRRGRRPDRAGPDRPGRGRPAWSGSSRSATRPPAQRAIREINAGIYAFDAAAAAGGAGQALHRQRPGRGVPDRRVRAAGRGRSARSACTWPPDADETLGCNDRAELAGLRALLRDRVNDGAGCGPGCRSWTRRPPGST